MNDRNVMVNLEPGKYIRKMIFQSVTWAVRKNVQERPRGMLLTGQALIPGRLNRRKKPRTLQFLCSLQKRG